MAKDNKKKAATIGHRYFKLGAAAPSFHDPRSGLNLAHPDEVAKIDGKYLVNHLSLTNALQNGHIKEVTKDDWEESPLQRMSDKDEPDIEQRKAEAKKKKKAGIVSPKVNASKVQDDDDDDEDEDTDEEEEEVDEDEDTEEEDEDDEDKKEKDAKPKGKGKK
jgi:hypothetical protein